MEELKYSFIFSLTFPNIIFIPLYISSNLISLKNFVSKPIFKENNFNSLFNSIGSELIKELFWFMK